MNAIGNVASERLRSFVDRIGRLEDEKDALAADVREIYSEAKGAGYDVPTIRQIVKDRHKDRRKIEEAQALLEIYRAALGHLDGTPLGDAARKRLAGEPPGKDPGKDDAKRDEGGGAAGGGADSHKPDGRSERAAADPFPGVDLDAARKMGTDAAHDGTSVMNNPFPAADPRRAAWDEAWCRASGTDGMDIPEAWRRAKPKKDSAAPGAADTGAENSAGADDAVAEGKNKKKKKTKKKSGE